MTARTIEELKADSETAETLRSAIDDIDRMFEQFPDKRPSFEELRAELLQEIQTIEGQGSLF
jgi:hypothetical protein